MYHGNNPKAKGIPPRIKYVFSELKIDPIIFNILIYLNANMI